MKNVKTKVSNIYFIFVHQMGYQAGKGLGKELQGRSTIVEAHLRKGRGAIGAYGREGGMKEVKRVDSEEEEETEFKEKLHQWKKGQKWISCDCKYLIMSYVIYI